LTKVEHLAASYGKNASAAPERQASERTANEIAGQATTIVFARRTPLRVAAKGPFVPRIELTAR